MKVDVEFKKKMFLTRCENSLGSNKINCLMKFLSHFKTYVKEYCVEILQLKSFQYKNNRIHQRSTQHCRVEFQLSHIQKVLSMIIFSPDAGKCLKIEKSMYLR